MGLPFMYLLVDAVPPDQRGFGTVMVALTCQHRLELGEQLPGHPE
jgi:hypothetical protein